MGTNLTFYQLFAIILYYFDYVQFSAASYERNNTMIVDAHLHLPWQEPDLNAKKDRLMAELEKNGVSGGVVIADSELESVIGSVAECVELFRGGEKIKVVAGISPLISFEGQLRLCRELLDRGDIAGLKVYTGHEELYCTDSSLFPVYDLAAEYRVPVLFHTGWDNSHYAAPERMKALAESRPQNIFVYCHCFYPNTEKCFEVLGDCGNVMFDTSSLADSEEHIHAIASSLERAIESMPHRIMYGSDYGSCDMGAHIRFAERLHLSEAQRRLFMSENAAGLYGII